MNKEMIRSFFKRGVLVMALFGMLWNCAEERDFVSEPRAFGLFDHKHRDVSYVVRNDIPANIRDFIYKRTLGTNQVVQNKSTGGFKLIKGGNKATVFGTIDESSAIVVTLSTQTRYSFLIRSNVHNSNELINLIIFDDETTTQEYFVKYVFDPNRQTRTAFNDVDMTQFSGTVSYFDGDGTLTGEYTVEDGRTSNANGSGTPCPPDDTNDPNNDDPTNNDDGGTGNGGCTVNCGGEDPDNTHEENGNDQNNSGGGEIENPDTCGLEWSYEPCCIGTAVGPGSPEPHSSDECGQCGQGNLNTLTITNTCTGQTWRNNTTQPFHCDDNTIGVIVGKDDCDEVNEQLTRPDFQDKIHELENKLNQPIETGYVENNTGNYVNMELASSDGSQLKFPVSNTIKGFMHNHSGPWLETNPNTGEVQELWPVNMFSPTDIKNFLSLLNNNDGTYFENSDLYSALVTFEGNYMLKFAGDVANSSQFPDNPRSNIGLKNLYNVFVRDQDNRVLGLLQFLKGYGITNMIIYEFNDLGIFEGHYLDQDGNYKTIECD